jgi:hypothetical protein
MRSGETRCLITGEQYCQDDVTVLREACQIFRRDLIEIGDIDVFLEAIRSPPHAIKCFANNF